MRLWLLWLGQINSGLWCEYWDTITRVPSVYRMAPWLVSWGMKQACSRISRHRLRETCVRNICKCSKPHASIFYLRNRGILLPLHIGPTAYLSCCIMTSLPLPIDPTAYVSTVYCSFGWMWLIFPVLLSWKKTLGIWWPLNIIFTTEANKPKAKAPRTM